MATKSILKDVKIRDKYLGRSLAQALENARASKIPPVSFQRMPKRIEKSEVKKFFGKEE